MGDFISVWANAIATFEGYNVPNSVAARNNNPGNLKYAGQPGATGQDSKGFAIFPDAATGFQALYNQLAAYVQEFPGYSILDMMAHYLGQSAPTSDAQGNAYSYANYVASKLGVDSSTTLAQLAGMVSPAPADSSGDGTDGTDGSDGNGGAAPIDGGTVALILVTFGLVFLAARSWWG